MANRNPLEALLDLVLYAPLGALAAVCEELPDLAEKGRSMLDERLRTARVVGQFAVAQGRREAERRINLSRNGAVPAGAPAGPIAVDAERLTGEVPQEAAPKPREPDSQGAGAARKAASGDARKSAGREQAPAVDVHLLAIPGYDSLSAPQVVQRLAGLSAEELEAVRRYEASHRGRQTILARVAQLHDRQ